MSLQTSPPAGTTRPPTRATNDLEALGERIAELSALISAATFHLLTLIREFDERGGWGCGFKSCAHWLSWRTGISLGPAREKVRVARALPNLPKISEATRRGEISYSKVRALTRIATPENEGKLLAFAMAGTASHVERLVRAWRKVDRLQDPGGEAERHAARYLQTYVDEDGMVVVRGRLDPEVGAAFQRALEAASDVLYEEEQSQPRVAATVEAGQRRADAVGRVAEAALAGGLDQGTRGDRYQVVVHVDAEVLANAARSERSPVDDRPGISAIEDLESVPAETSRRMAADSARTLSASETARMEGVPAETSVPPAAHSAEPPGVCEIEDAGSVPAETSRRLACDAARVVMTHDAGGRILDVGRRTRVISPALRRALAHRDGGCRFPGCGLKLCDAHHVEHWADGGTTRLANLVLLCRRHHRCVHEEGYVIERPSDGELRFLRPDGRELPVVPPTPPAARTLTNVATAITGLQGWLTEAAADVEWTDHYPEWDGSRLDLRHAISVMWSSREPQRGQADRR